MGWHGLAVIVAHLVALVAAHEPEGAVVVLVAAVIATTPLRGATRPGKSHGAPRRGSERWR